MRMAPVCLLLALTPFAAWSGRNWQVFHVFEPLAPRYANDPGDDDQSRLAALGQDLVPGLCFDLRDLLEWPRRAARIDQLPGRAFDSPWQYAETAALIADYNEALALTPEFDARFERLARERIAARPLRYYLWLPLGRMADMWLRPRVENLPIDLDWWVYEHHNDETVFSWAYAGLNALYLLLAVGGLWLRPRLSTPRTKTCPWGPQLSTQGRRPVLGGPGYGWPCWPTSCCAARC